MARIGGAKSPTVKHTRYTVKGKKLPSMKAGHITALKNTVKMKGLKLGKKTTATINPLRMKAN